MAQRATAQRAIGYAIRECSLGRVLIAASARGICHVRFGESERDLVEQLQSELPFATLERAEIQLKEWSDVLIACIDGGGEGQSEGSRAVVELPLDVSASRFQRRVWQALERIPCGETRSYSDVAKSLGLAKGARAVARAAATSAVPPGVAKRRARWPADVGVHRTATARPSCRPWSTSSRTAR